MSKQENSTPVRMRAFLFVSPHDTHIAPKLRTLATKFKINHVSTYTRSILRVTYFQSEYYKGQNEESLSHTID